MKTRTEQVLVSLLYCGAMSGRPNLIYLWLLAGTPLSSLALGLGEIGLGLGVRALTYLSAFVWGALSGALHFGASQEERPESTATPAEESSPDPTDC